MRDLPGRIEDYGYTPCQEPTAWHELEVAEAGDYKYGAAKVIFGCCTPNRPCALLTAYYTHSAVPAELPVGAYRMRLGVYGLLEVERA